MRKFSELAIRAIQLFIFDLSRVITSKTANNKDGSIMQTTTTTKVFTIYAIKDAEGPILKSMSDGEEIYTARYNKFENVIEMLKELKQEPIPTTVDDLVKGYDIKGVTRQALNAALLNNRLMNK